MSQNPARQIFLDRLSFRLRNHPEILINESCLEKMAKHFELLSKWNQAHNLISVTDLEAVICEHYLDSVLALQRLTQHLASQSPVYDLGSGNGFPGIIGAILWPDRDVVLVESLRKKCSFLRTAAAELDLKHMRVEQKRVEELSKIEFAVSRAAFSEDAIPYLSTFFALNGILALMRVPSPEFLKTLGKGSWEVVDQINYTLDTGASRCVLVLRNKTGST